MSVATQTFGLPLSRSTNQATSFLVIGTRVWRRMISSVQASMARSAEARAERELLALAAQYEKTMPSFAAELRAANTRR